jgi:DNA-binding transcriptional ArsR family regulator
MKETRDITTTANVFRALGNPYRLGIYKFLVTKKERASVSRLETVLDIKQSHLSQSLGILNQAGLVIREREGSRVFYSANRQYMPELAAIVGKSG